VRGSTYKRCGCRDSDGRQLGAGCPDLKKPGHGRWYYRLDTGLDPKTGRRTEERVTKAEWQNQSDAQEDLAIRHAELAAGDSPLDGNQTVGVYLKGWLERKVQDGLRPSSERMYRAYVDDYLVPALGSLRLSDLRPGHVDQLLRDLRRAGRGATTIRRVHAVLSSALTSARRARLVSYNAAADVELPKPGDVVQGVRIGRTQARNYRVEEIRDGVVWCTEFWFEQGPQAPERHCGYSDDAVELTEVRQIRSGSAPLQGVGIDRQPLGTFLTQALTPNR
jgi:hypothetical protein